MDPPLPWLTPVFLHGVGDTDADSLLAAVKMEKSPHLPLTVELRAGFLELPNPHHVTIDGKKLLTRQGSGLLLLFHNSSFRRLGEPTRDTVDHLYIIGTFG